MEGDIVYDLCIVGAGMMGSAAARHATIKPGIKVCLIGPEEPKSRQSSRIFGAHYDEGRIARAVHADPTLGELSHASILQFRQLEKDTGIKFYENVGFLSMRSSGHQDLQQCLDTARQLRVPLDQVDTSEIRRRFRDVNIPDEFCGLVDKTAGYINPRKMMSAEQTAAHLQGCDVIRDVVTHVTESSESEQKRASMKVVTEKGQIIRAHRVLLAPGAFIQFNQLLPKGVEPDILLFPLTAVFGEVSKQDAERLKYLPAMNYKGDYYHSDIKADAERAGFYYLPPIAYPDGKVYMKIGHYDGYFGNVLDKQEDVKAWYCNPAPLEYKDEHVRWLKKIFPGVAFKSFHADTCVVTITKSGLPYIDLIHPRLGVAFGGGYGAMSCDEIGRMGADLVLRGSWEHKLPAELFKFRAKQTKLLGKL